MWSAEYLGVFTLPSPYHHHGSLRLFNWWNLEPCAKKKKQDEHNCTDNEKSLDFAGVFLFAALFLLTEMDPCTYSSIVHQKVKDSISFLAKLSGNGKYAD